MNQINIMMKRCQNFCDLHPQHKTKVILLGTTTASKRNPALLASSRSSEHVKRQIGSQVFTETHPLLTPGPPTEWSV